MQKRFVGVISLCLCALLLSAPVTHAQQIEGQVAQITVFYDTNANGVFDASLEAAQPDWTVTSYDSSLNELDAFLSTNVENDVYIVNPATDVICLNPVFGWLQTTAGDTPHPDASGWFCQSIDEVEVFMFGVFPNEDGQEGEPDDDGQIRIEDPTKAIEKELPTDDGQVLGATDTGNVLAETGNPAIFAALYGVLLLLMAAYLAKASKSYKNR